MRNFFSFSKNSPGWMFESAAALFHAVIQRPRLVATLLTSPMAAKVVLLISSQATGSGKEQGGVLQTNLEMAFIT